VKKSPKRRVKGIRWILDCVGTFEGGKTATHAATSRHDGIDYLRGSNGGFDGQVVPDFERGFCLLEKHGLSFDLQCAPAQLLAASKFLSKYPKIPVCIDHLGKPRTLLGPDTDESKMILEPDETELAIWREGMKAMAGLPHVYVKISMLGYAIPGWIRNEARKNAMRDLVCDTVQLFGPQRCMVATNWWKSAAVSDSDGLSDVGPDPVQLLTLLSGFLKDHSEEDRNRIFCGTAREFYCI
jgi:predicted TIM-barrel fold metal-dependent hydrolase